MTPSSRRQAPPTATSSRKGWLPLVWVEVPLALSCPAQARYRVRWVCHVRNRGPVTVSRYLRKSPGKREGYGEEFSQSRPATVDVSAGHGRRETPKTAESRVSRCIPLLQLLLRQQPALRGDHLSADIEGDDDLPPRGPVRHPPHVRRPDAGQEHPHRRLGASSQPSSACSRTSGSRSGSGRQPRRGSTWPSAACSHSASPDGCSGC